MTDHPKFEPVSCRPEEAHRRYSGGSLVDLVLAIVDYRALQRPTGRVPRTLKLELSVLIALVLLLAGVVTTIGPAHSLKSVLPDSAEMRFGPDPSPDADASTLRRRAPHFHPYASYTP